MILRRAMAGWLVLLAMAGGAPAPAATVESFDYPSAAAAGAAWQPREAAPAVRLAEAGGGVVFPLPFTRDVDRYYWDRAGAWDLSRCTSLALNLACDQPEALRALYLYFKSGNGWYVWSTKLNEPGRQALIIQKDTCTTEGTPAGWDRIEGLRVSPWKGLAVHAELTLLDLRAQVDAIYIVQGTASHGSDADRKVAERVATRLSRWLAELGIPHGVIKDEDVAAGALDQARIAILGYPGRLPAGELTALRQFARQGGQLVVCYGSDPALADLMGVQLGTYTAARRQGQWASFVFNNSVAWHLPKRVYQESWNIHPVQPADDAGQVIAWWADMDGRLTRDPAWVATPRGLWMTHILLEDDALDKQMMLQAMLAHLDPALWAPAARHMVHRAGRVASFESLPNAIAGIAQQARAGGTEDAVAPWLTSAERLFKQMLQDFEQGRYPAAVEGARKLQATLTEALARAQSPRQPEFRGIWDHRGVGLYPGHWSQTCRELRLFGLTAVFPNLAGAGFAHYPSLFVPRSKTVQLYGDQLAQCAAAARKNGLAVHAWILTWNLDGADDAYLEKLRRAGRLQLLRDGQPIPWLDPAVPANRAQMLEVCREIARRGNVDGIHLDYIRYPVEKAGYNPATRAAFEAWLGRPATDWDGTVTGTGPLAPEYQRWRAQLITAFVREVRAAVRAINPRLQLSAAVFGGYPQCIRGVGQDWGTWLKNDYVDFVCPMNYTPSAKTFADMVYAQVKLPNAPGRLYPGLGITAAESQLAGDQVLDQIRIARQYGAAGFVLFQLDPEVKNEILPLLRLGATRGQ